MDDFEIDARIADAIHAAVEAGWTVEQVRESVEAAIGSAWEPE